MTFLFYDQSPFCRCNECHEILSPGGRAQTVETTTFSEKLMFVGYCWFRFRQAQPNGLLLFHLLLDPRQRFLRGLQTGRTQARVNLNGAAGEGVGLL